MVRSPEKHRLKLGDGWIYVLIHQRRGKHQASLKEQFNRCQALIRERAGGVGWCGRVYTLGTNRDRLVEQAALKLLRRQQCELLIAASRDIKRNRVAKKLIDAAERQGIEIVLVDEAESAAL